MNKIVSFLHTYLPPTLASTAIILFSKGIETFIGAITLFFINLMLNVSFNVPILKPMQYTALYIALSLTSWLIKVLFPSKQTILINPSDVNNP